jgi:hypothetical protein
MTNLLDVLKEAELRVRFTDAFHTIGTREVLSPEVLYGFAMNTVH